MINKQSLWFLTLFSLILVLSIYYITMPNELLLSNNNSYVDKEGKKDSDKNDSSNDDKTKVTINESEYLTAMRVNWEEERQEMIKELQAKLTNAEMTVEEKNEAYEQIKYLEQIKGTEEKLEEKIKSKYNLNSFVSIQDSKINVVVSSNEHNSELANNIMRTIQEEFKTKVYITVKFQA